MTSDTSAFSKDVLRDPQDFSLVLGGPLFQLLRRSHLVWRRAGAVAANASS